VRSTAVTLYSRLRMMNRVSSVGGLTETLNVKSALLCFFKQIDFVLLVAIRIALLQNRSFPVVFFTFLRNVITEILKKIAVITRYAGNRFTSFRLYEMHKLIPVF
jgi:hypothetical protein